MKTSARWHPACWCAAQLFLWKGDWTMSERRFAGRAVGLFVVVALLVVGAAAAQVTAGQTGTLQGSVRLQEGPAAGVTVTVTSTALQGSRSTVTGENGDYILRALPPGDYKVVFTLEGMTEETRMAAVTLASVARV